jgi:hypothetical protein
MAARTRVWTCPVCDTRIVGCRHISRHEDLLKQGLCHARAPGQSPTPIIFGHAPNTTPEPSITPSMLSRRSQIFTCSLRPVDQMPSSAKSTKLTRDMVHVQDAWQHYLRQVGDQFSPKFWAFFLSMHEQPTVAIDAALTGVKKVFVAGADLQKFANSKRHMFQRIRKKVNPFFPRVTHCVTIDLSPCGVPEKLKFRFLDPVWAWIVAANKLPAEDIHFIPKEQFDFTGERMHGGGVQYGECFAQAFHTCPAGTFPMLVNLHWDGTAAHELPATPIAVGVANCNCQSADAHTCVGYIPSTSATLSARDKTAVKFYIRQKCVGAILSVLEAAARTGVTCFLA